MRHRAATYLAFSLALLAAFLGGACTQSPVLRVGFLNPQTGSLTDTGASCMEGARLAVDEMNAGGGILAGGRRYHVELVVGDTGDTPEAAVDAALDLINRQGVSVLIGPPFSSQAIPVARLAERSRVPMITQFSTNPDVTRGMTWVYRVCFTDQLQGSMVARFAFERLAARRVAVLYDRVNAFTRDIAAIFMHTFKAEGGRVVAEESYTTGEQAFDEELTRIRASSPDALFLPGLSPDLRIQLSRAEALGIHAAILGCDTMFFRDERDVRLADGAYIATHFSADVPTPIVTTFDGVFQAAYKRQPTPGAALTYDAFKLLAHVVQEAGSTEAARVRLGLSRIGRFEGVTGLMVFAGRADPAKSGLIVRALGGAYHFSAIVPP